MVPLIKSLQKEMQDRADFLMVYILEAHAQDEWPISSGKYVESGESVCVNQPTSNEERLAVLNEFMKNYPIDAPFLVDRIENEFDNIFAAWPTRFYIVENGEMCFKAQPKWMGLGKTYDFEQVRQTLMLNDIRTAKEESLFKMSPAGECILLRADVVEEEEEVLSKEPAVEAESEDQQPVEAEPIKLAGDGESTNV
eukprot:TRINITY_DN6779_c0_g1_i1.p1 TRINITY_DN6779_c0_g1~~TRINITY_DN6779_c0_g1_i1.p1  ORF type:complete len:196 (+),score=43.25 TRINITY_DN6779_c0_g1_i1:416-1003(+)